IAIRVAAAVHLEPELLGRARGSGQRGRVQWRADSGRRCDDRAPMVGRVDTGDREVVIVFDIEVANVDLIGGARRGGRPGVGRVGRDRQVVEVRVGDGYL